MPYRIGCTGGGFVCCPDCLSRCESGWGEKWGACGGGGKEQGEVLMGKRRMVCSCQNWSCAEERVGENEMEDGRRAWLINLFTSLKTLRAPFWLKFSLPSIIASAALNLQSCRYQALSKQSSLQSEPSPPHPPTANLWLFRNAFICIICLLVISWLILLTNCLYPSYAGFVCTVCLSLSTPPTLLLSFLLSGLTGNCLCLGLFPPVTFFPNSRLLAHPA